MAKKVGEIGLEEIRRAIGRLRGKMSGVEFERARPLDVWKEIFCERGVFFGGSHYYGAEGSPKPTRSQVVMMSRSLAEAKSGCVNQADAVEAVVKILGLTNGNAEEAIALLDDLERLVNMAGGLERAKQTIRVAEAIRRSE